MILLENNATGQFANQLKQVFHFEIDESKLYLHYSGKPFSVEEVLEILSEEVVSK